MRRDGRTATKSDLVNLIARHFSEADLRQLCLELDVSYDALRGSGTQEKAVSLVEYCADRAQLGQLLAAAAEARPHLADALAEMSRTLPRQWSPGRRADGKSARRFRRTAAMGGAALFLALLLLLAAGWGWRAYTSRQAWPYELVVLDGVSGEPAPHAAVTLTIGGALAPFEGTTDDDGRVIFVLPAWADGRIASLTVEKAGRPTAIRTVTLGARQPPQEVTLPPSP